MPTIYASLCEKLSSLDRQVAKLNLQAHYVRRFVEKAREYIEMPKLTAELLRVFIRRIEMFEKL